MNRHEQRAQQAHTRHDDKAAARRMVEEDMRAGARALRGLRGPVHFVSGEDRSNWPTYANGGERMLLPVTIGTRNELTEQDARRCADMWRAITERYPRAMLMLNLLGYDQDPREIWEIEEAARYVRCWAHFSGMDDLETAERWIGASSAICKSGLDPRLVGSLGLSFLAACGVYGPEARQQVLAGFTPTREH